MVERNTSSADMRGVAVPPRSKASSRAQGAYRKLGGPAFGPCASCTGVRIGKRECVADDVQTQEVGHRHSSAEVGEQSGGIRGGAGGAKDGDQGECGQEPTCWTQSRWLKTAR